MNMLFLFSSLFLNQVFGALLSDAPVPTDHFFGTGESFLFTFADPPGEEEEDGGKRTPSGNKKDDDEVIVKEEDVVVKPVKVEQTPDGTEDPAVEAESDEEERKKAGKETARILRVFFNET
jgi:hypothetical protein